MTSDAGMYDRDESYWSGGGYSQPSIGENLNASLSDLIGIYRFRNVTIPQGAVIQSAYVEGESYGDYASDTCNSKIYCEDADNPDFPASAADANNRARTSAHVDWSAVPHWTAEQRYASPDLTAIVQQIVNRGGWASGNAMQFFFENDGGDEGAIRRWRNTSALTKLHIEYLA